MSEKENPHEIYINSVLVSLSSKLTEDAEQDNFGVLYDPFVEISIKVNDEACGSTRNFGSPNQAIDWALDIPMQIYGNDKVSVDLLWFGAPGSPPVSTTVPFEDLHSLNSISDEDHESDLRLQQGNELVNVIICFGQRKSKALPLLKTLSANTFYIIIDAIRIRAKSVLHPLELNEMAIWISRNERSFLRGQYKVADEARRVGAVDWALESPVGLRINDKVSVEISREQSPGSPLVLALAAFEYLRTLADMSNVSTVEFRQSHELVNITIYFHTANSPPKLTPLRHLEQETEHLTRLRAVESQYRIRINAIEIHVKPTGKGLSFTEITIGIQYRSARFRHSIVHGKLSVGEEARRAGDRTDWTSTYPIRRELRVDGKVSVEAPREPSDPPSPPVVLAVATFEDLHALAAVANQDEQYDRAFKQEDEFMSVTTYFSAQKIPKQMLDYLARFRRPLACKQAPTSSQGSHVGLPYFSLDSAPADSGRIQYTMVGTKRPKPPP